MRIIDNWQYRYIEKSLYNYKQMKDSLLATEMLMVKAIEKALEYFEGNHHEIMIEEFYFKADENKNKYTSNMSHYKWVCENRLFMEEPNGYVIRREIIYRVAMNCYGLQLFKILG